MTKTRLTILVCILLLALPLTVGLKIGEYNPPEVNAWKITSTGAEQFLNVTYDEVGDTGTIFCIEYNDKTAYLNELSKDLRDVTNIPLTKIDKTDKFNINSAKIDLSKTNEGEKKCFEIAYTKFEPGIKLKIGWESVYIEGFITTINSGSMVGDNKNTDTYNYHDAQTFNLTYNSTITEVTWYYNSDVGLGAIEWYFVAIQTLNASGKPSGVMVDACANTSLDGAGLSAGNWYNWTFPCGVNLTAGVTYALVLTSNETMLGSDHEAWYPGGTNGNPYNDGTAFIKDSTGWEIQSDWDFAFMLYGKNWTAGGGVPPEAGSRNITLHSPPNNGITNDDINTYINYTPISNESAILECTVFYRIVIDVVNVTNNTYYNVSLAGMNDGINSTWYVNCTDAKGIIQSEKRLHTIDETPPVISSFDIYPGTISTLNDSHANITATDFLHNLKVNLSCYVNQSLITSETGVSLTNNTNHNFSLIGSSNYSRNDNLSCNVTVYDMAGNTATAGTYVIISDIPPTRPNNINFSTPAFYFNFSTSFDANGSTDADSDNITYFFRVYNVQEATIRQSWTSTNSYSPVLADTGDTLRIDTIARTDLANSSVYNETRIVYLGSMSLFIRREKTNSLFDVSGADEMSVSIICEDDVEEYNITLNTTDINISCAYEFIKADATYSNNSYFRIINPSYSAFTNITLYMLDLRYDTGVEIILTINDLTGDYSNGEIKIERYLNGSLVTIISQPVDIEASATLYLLKDMLYTVKVSDNAGEERVIGNLIASSPGSKTLTLPEITFFPDDASLGDEVNWNYTYNSSSFIQLLYADASNTTINVTFTIFDLSNNSHIVFSSTSYSSRITFTYPFNNTENHTFMSNLTIHHPDFGKLFEQKIFYPGGNFMTSGEQGLFENISTWLFWISTIIIFVIGLTFSAQTSKIGLGVVLFFIIMFVSFGWLNYGVAGSVVIGLFAVLTILNLISKSREVKE